MIEAREVQELHDRPSEELRELMAHCAGIHAHRHGSHDTAVALTRIAYALEANERKGAHA
jgi:hypothetical protein